MGKGVYSVRIFIPFSIKDLIWELAYIVLAINLLAHVEIHLVNFCNYFKQFNFTQSSVTHFKNLSLRNIS